MSVDLGDLGDIATAIGLLQPGGDPRPDWFADPEKYLKRILSDSGQRTALLDAVDDLLGGSHATTDGAGRTWVPLFEHGPVAVSAVVAEAADGDAVHVGVGVRVDGAAAAGGVGVVGEVYVPLFAAAGDEPVADPLLLGKPGAVVELSLALALPSGAAPGAVSLSSVGVSARIPTLAGVEPTVGLSLLGLRMPGAATSRDIVVDADDIEDLDDALLELVLGLVQASTDAIATTEPARGLAGLLGLVDGDDVPDFPVAEVLAGGASALATWLASCLEGPARTAWLGHLATLLSGQVIGAGADATVRVPLGGGVNVLVDVATTPGASGLPVVTPRVAVEVTGGPGTSLRLEVQPVSLDLGTGSAIALPSLTVLALVGSGGAGALLGPVDGPGNLDITIGSFEGGFALDADRRPSFVLRARDAIVGTTEYPTLDLTDGDALAGVAGDAVETAAGDLLGLLGPVGGAVGVLLGLVDPPAGPAPRIDGVRMLADPIGALRSRWAALLAADAQIFRSVLATWQAATAAQTLRTRAIEGDGTPAAPYRVAVAEGVDVLVSVDGAAVSVALAARLATPLALGAEIEADVRVEVLRAGLSDAAPSAQFVTGLIAVIALGAPGDTPLRLAADGYGLSLLSVGARLAWDPATGARLDPWLEQPRLVLAGTERPFPVIGVGGPAGVAFPPVVPPLPADWSDEIWSAAEAAAGALLAAAARERAAAAGAADALATLLTAAAELTGWSPEAPHAMPRLSLAAVVADPRAELERWARLLLGDGGGRSRVPELVVGLLGQLLGLPVTGAGVGDLPWAVPLPGCDLTAAASAPAVAAGLAFGRGVPALLLALGAPTVDRYGSRAPLALISWRPGDPSLSTDVLAQGVAADAEVDDVLADALAGRGSLAAGFDALTERWTGSDGVVALPDELAPAGVTVHRTSGLVHAARLDSAHVTAALAAVWPQLGGEPTRVMLVGVVADGEPDVLPPPGTAGIAADVDLTAVGAAVEGFPVPPAAAAGTTVVRLGGRASTGAAGFDGQVARLRRALSGLATAANPVAVVAGAGAGRIAVAAAGGLPGVEAVVTVATPWTPLTLADVDTAPATDGLRMLRTLLDLGDADLAGELEGLDEAERTVLLAEDEDLALARGLVDSLLARDGRGDPLTELTTPEAALPPGLAVHAVVGSCAPEAVRRAITAAVATGLAGRSRRRVAEAGAGGTTAALGVHVPAGVGGAAGGLRAAIGLDAELLRWSEAGLAGPSLRVRLRLSGDGRWLVGGPDAARQPGPRPLAVRAVTLELTVPLPSWGSQAGATASLGRLVLHDATAFGIRRARWLVDLSDAGALVPEARALLGEVAAQLKAQAEGAADVAADAAIAGLVDALQALGVLDLTGGFDATTLAGMLANPKAVLDATLADATRTLNLAAGLRSAVGDARAAAGSTVELRSGAVRVVVDLAARSATVAAAADFAGGAVHASLAVGVGAGAADVTARIGTADLETAGTPGAGIDVACRAPARGGLALTVGGRLRDPRGVRTVALWPATPETASELLALAPDGLAATALQAALTALRATLARLEPGAGADPAALVDALLSAAGLLRAAPAPALAEADAETGEEIAAAVRSVVVWPSGLLSDPRAWLQTAAGDLPAALPALVDAVAGLLPAAGPRAPGSLPITAGVSVRAASTSGRLALLLEIDAAAFAGAPGELVLAITAGLEIGTAADGVSPSLSVELGAGAVGAIRVRVGSDAGGADPAIGVTVTLLPSSRPEITLYPAARGLSGLADAAAAGAVAALPPLLTRLAQEDPPGAAPATTAAQVAGRIVGRGGVALGLASGTPAVFSGPTLTAFAADPAAAFAARAADMTSAGLTLVVDAVRATLGSPATRSVAREDGRVAITIGPADRRIVVGWRPGTSALDATVTIGNLAPVGAIMGSLRVSPTGVELVDVAVGPATIALGGATLSPFARIAAGSSLPAPSVDLGLGAGASWRLVARFGPAGVSVLAARGPAGAVEESFLERDIAAAVVGALIDVAGGLVLEIEAVETALRAPVLGTTTAALLESVLLAAPAGAGNPLRIDPTLAADLTEPLKLLRRLALAVGNAGAAMGPITLGGVLDVRVAGGATVGLTLAVTGDEWVLNPQSDVRISLVTDAEWIDPDVPSGITLEAVRLPAGGGIEFAPGVVGGGVGVRVSRGSGPLLDAGLTIESVSVLGFGLVRLAAGGALELGGGARLELAGLGVPLGGGGDGSNPTAAGVMPSAGAGDDAPAPRFSPALAVQKHPGRALAVSLSAGPGSGPWFLQIQREFGPIYLEQVGLAVGQDGGELRTIGVLIDGKVSLFGLSAAVDDLSLTYTVSGDGSPFDARRWKIDVAGFAITAELSGLTLAGGLRKFTPAEGGSEYLGMLLARLGVYGITVYGGFGEVGPPNDKFTSMFLFGAVNGPIGGPPAFFLTGIGGGFGANRGLVVPTDLSQFGSYPLVKALDPAARAGDPFTELAQARGHFPAQRGQFWFAAGISFNSFALVDGVVVVAVSFGNGLEISILGLARMALPRPQAALVSIELALVARISTREGVVLVQAQLTDNSWLIAPAVRLTGGFAFAAWFGGPNKGQFVLTLGGYHPDFHRDGYPVVPRLGLTWQIGDAVSVSGGSYFALTSEALMAGMKVEIHAQIGPAWAHLVFGADGIVYFDPFWLSVTIYASIDAGVTIDLWFAEITISVHLSARLTVTGPPFRAVARFEIGPVGVTFAIGPAADDPPPLTWPAFVTKYLEEAAPGRARALSAITGAGTVPPAGGAATGGDTSPDGQPDRPFRVVAEFTATITSTIPLRELSTAGATTTLPASHTVSVAPMGASGTATPRTTVSIRRRVTGPVPGAGGPDATAPDRIAALRVRTRRDGAFPIGAWGAAQDLSDPKVPAGDVLAATDRIEIEATAVIPAGGPLIPYRQVETGRRRVLPLLATATDAAVNERVAGSAVLKSALDDAVAELGEVGAGNAAVAAQLLTARGARDELSVATWQAGLAAPVMLGSLGEGLGPAAAAVQVASRTPPAAREPEIRPPKVLAVLSSGEQRMLRAGGERDARKAAPPSRTTVSDELVRAVVDDGKATARRVEAPSLETVVERLSSAIPARLVATPALARVAMGTVVSTGALPTTSAGLPGAAAVARRAAPKRTLDALSARTSALLDGAGTVSDGQVLVVELPDANIDTARERPALACRSGRVRVVLLGAAGRVLKDVVLAEAGRTQVPVGTRTAVVVGGPSPVADGGPWIVAGGWTAARALPSASDGLLVAAGAVVDVLGRVPHRGADPARAAWVAPAELLGRERGTVTTLAGPDSDRHQVLAAIAVVIGGTGTEGLVVGLDGADQAGAPLVSADAAGASVLVVGLGGTRRRSPVTVTVASDPDAAPRDVLGLVAVSGDPRALKTSGPAAAAWLASAVAGADLASLVPPPTSPGPAGSTIAWEVP